MNRSLSALSYGRHVPEDGGDVSSFAAAFDLFSYDRVATL